MNMPTFFPIGNSGGSGSGCGNESHRNGVENAKWGNGTGNGAGYDMGCNYYINRTIGIGSGNGTDTGSGDGLSCGTTGDSTMFEQIYHWGLGESNVGNIRSNKSLNREKIERDSI